MSIPAVQEPSSPNGLYNPRNYYPDCSVGFLMKRVLASMMQHAEVQLEPHDITHAQWLPLYKLRHEGRAMKAAELARELQMDTGAMTRMLDRLEKKGLCKRVRSSEDRRIVLLQLTPQGESIAALAPAVMSEVMNKHLAGFSKSEWQALLGYLRRMLENGATAHAKGPRKPGRAVTAKRGSGLTDPFIERKHTEDELRPA